MKTKRIGKNALIMSALALVLCVSMLVGTTFAWFTDSVTSKNNIIKSGNLDVVLEYRTVDKDTGELTDWAVVEEDTALFSENSLWEPGHTEYVYLRVSNVGTLALKYTLAAEVYSETEGTNVYNQQFLLSDYLMYGVVNELDTEDREAAVAAATEAMKAGMDIAGVTTADINETLSENSLLPGENAAVETALIITMPTTVGNEANHLTGTEAPKITFGVNLLATQLMHEEDSFGDDYDEDATYYPVVTTAAELAEKLAAGESVSLAEDVVVDSTITVAKGKDAVIDLNGHNLSATVSNEGKAAAIISNNGTLEITGEGTLSFVAADPDLNAIPSYATNTITNNGTLTIGEGVVVTNGSEGGASYAVDNYGVFILDGGRLEGERCALRVAKFNQPNVEFVMNSGEIVAATPMWIHLPGSDANTAPNISVTINGGTIESTKATSADNDVMYTYSFGNSHANTSVVINGGEFLGGTVSIGSGYTGDAPALEINGGTFEYDVLQWLEGDGSQVLFAANK